MKKAKKAVVKKKKKPQIARRARPAKPAPRAKGTTKPAKSAASAVVKPAATQQPPAPKKLKLSKDQVEKFRKLLLDLRDHLIDGVNFLASENLKRSHRDASGELSGYSLHMADAGTDTFDREFALSLVSSEQEALYEIEEAFKRLEGGTYGVCEMCEKIIGTERLEALPFARLCVQCQSGVEKERRGVARPVSSFAETTDDEGGEGDEAEEKE